MAQVTWLTTAQASHRLEVSSPTIRYMGERGQLRFEMTPHGRLFDPESVEELRQKRAAERAAKEKAS